jgi:hypothetical protein
MKNFFTAEFVSNLIATAFVVGVGWFFFDLTRAECYMTWLIIVGNARLKREIRL